MRPARLLLAALTTLSLAACGTTVPLTEQVTTSGEYGASTGDGLGGTGSGAGGLGTATGGAGTGGSGGFGTGGSATGGTTGTGSTGTGSGATGSTGAGSGSAAGGAVRGTADKTPVRVGFEVIQGGNAAISAAFGTPVNFGDGKREVTAIVNDINAKGGINGRRVVPFFADWNVADGDAGRNQTCSKLTEDDKVEFIITVINVNQQFVKCAADHKVPVVNASFGAGDRYIYKTYGDFFFSPSLMHLDREMRLVAQTLYDAGTISPSVKTGIVIDGTGDPQYQRVYNDTVDPLLKQLGVPHESFVVATQSDVSAAILRFNQDQVKVVLFVAPSGIIEVLFMQAAEQQQYRPKYGLGDSTSPWFVASAAPENQVKGISGAGSLPISNVETSEYPTTPKEKVCLDLIKAAGEDNADRHSSITATVYCEAIRAFAAVGERVSGRLTADSFRAAYASVGRTYTPVTTFAIDFANGRHDNAAAYRAMAWQDRCGCVTYTSPLRALTP